MSTAKVTSKGQITIPADVRHALNLESGDKVDFVIDDESGAVAFKPVTKPIASLKGVIKHAGKTVTIDDMNAVIKSRGAKK